MKSPRRGQGEHRRPPFQLIARVGPWALALAVIAALLAPMIATTRSFGLDWGGHLWLVNVQAHNVLDLGRPSYFIQSNLGAFYPWFAFYGGTLYSVVGGVVALVDQPIPVYVASYAAAFLLAHLGMTWLARQAGLRGWLAQAPGIAYVTSAYYVTDVYARGAWPETVAVSALPLVLAAGVSIARSPVLRVGPAAALLLGTAIVAGSHNITLLCGFLFVLAMAGIGLFAAGGRRRALARRLGIVGALLGLGVGLNLWFLLIAVAHRHDVPIGQEFLHRPSTPQLTPGVLASPYRFSAFAPLHTTFDLQAPTLLLVWSGLALWLARPLPRYVRRLAAGFLAVLVILCLLLLVEPAWSLVPHALWFIQFPYRLETYVALCAAGLMILSLIALARVTPRVRRGLAAGLTALLAVESAQAVVQAWKTPSFLSDRGSVVARPVTQAPPWWYPFANPNEFADVSARVVRPTLASIPGVTVPGLPARAADGRHAQTLSVPVVDSIRKSYDLWFPLPRPGSVITNVIGGPYLVKVTGATPVGRTLDSRMVVRIGAPAPSRNAHVAFSTAHSPIVLAGLAGSVASLLASVMLLAGLALRRRRTTLNRAAGAARIDGGSS